MGLPITTTDGGICFAFPDICNTPIGTGSVPVPYPNIGKLDEAKNVSTNVNVAGHPVILKNSVIENTTGDEAGTAGINRGKVEFVSWSNSVKVNGQNVVRMTDATTQNSGNATGKVLKGVANVLCG